MKLSKSLPRSRLCIFTVRVWVRVRIRVRVRVRVRVYICFACLYRRTIPTYRLGLG